MSEFSPEQTQGHRLLEEADALLAMCNIIEKREGGECVERKLTPDFAKHLRRVKEMGKLKGKPMSEAVQEEGFLTLVVITYLHGRGFSQEFNWNSFVPMVGYLTGFFQGVFPEKWRKVKTVVYDPETKFWNRVFAVQKCGCPVVYCFPLDRSHVEWFSLGRGICSKCDVRHDTGVAVFHPEHPPFPVDPFNLCCTRELLFLRDWWRNGKREAYE